MSIERDREDVRLGHNGRSSISQREAVKLADDLAAAREREAALRKALQTMLGYASLARDSARAFLRAEEPSRCPRCEGYEATYHTFKGECSEAEEPQP